MKRILPVLTVALTMTACFKDPPPSISKPMFYYETLCNNPWGPALTTKQDTVAAWLSRHNIRYEYLSIQGEIFSSAVNVTKCDTLTNRQIVVAVLYADTSKAAATGFKSPY
ncbi:hypothetical protein [Chitinophaga eiseniae]|uniref:Lipoprotein n=1 Tax=Chitinophaga eiseniae TaxID=634771 RepID=A0A847SYC0_9BACT|nr:hypothetical protein [Chitinophaga eiseniae]NLR82992.1 hypothetical protein [Chitinophaga eiseniae]